MNNKYNVLVNYLGDGEFKFTVKKIGEVNISKTKPIYIYNADVEVINSLRILRRLLIEIKIGAKPTGAYKVYDMDEVSKETTRFYDNRINADRRGYVEAVSNADISNILSSGTNGPIEIEIPTNKEAIVTEPLKDSEVIDIKVSKTTKKTTKKSSNKKTSKK